MGSIEIEALSKTFSKRKSEDVVAVDRLDLTLYSGHDFGFLGPNGAGKTTTIKMMCGLVTPSSGSVRLNGYDIGRQRSEAVRQLGVVLEGTRQGREAKVIDLATDFDYQVNVNLRFTFGSIFNNIVNPRFDGGGGRMFF